MSVLLVRVECLCGTIAAIPEGGTFPLCGHCGRRMVCPLRGEPGDINNVVAYVAARMTETEAVKERKTSPEEWLIQGHAIYTPEHLIARLESMGWPVEGQPWPERVNSADYTISAPPWEPVG